MLTDDLDPEEMILVQKENDKFKAFVQSNPWRQRPLRGFFSHSELEKLKNEKSKFRVIFEETDWESRKRSLGGGQEKEGIFDRNDISTLIRICREKVFGGSFVSINCLQHLKFLDLDYHAYADLLPIVNVDVWKNPDQKIIIEDSKFRQEIDGKRYDKLCEPLVETLFRNLFDPGASPMFNFLLLVSFIRDQASSNWIERYSTPRIYDETEYGVVMLFNHIIHETRRKFLSFFRPGSNSPKGGMNMKLMDLLNEFLLEQFKFLTDKSAEFMVSNFPDDILKLIVVFTERMFTHFFVDARNKMIPKIRRIFYERGVKNERYDHFLDSVDMVDQEERKHIFCTCCDPSRQADECDRAKDLVRGEQMESSHEEVNILFSEGKFQECIKKFDEVRSTVYIDKLIDEELRNSQKQNLISLRMTKLKSLLELKLHPNTYLERVQIINTLLPLNQQEEVVMGIMKRCRDELVEMIGFKKNPPKLIKETIEVRNRRKCNVANGRLGIAPKMCCVDTDGKIFGDVNFQLEVKPRLRIISNTLTFENCVVFFSTNSESNTIYGIEVLFSPFPESKRGRGEEETVFFSMSLPEREKVTLVFAKGPFLIFMTRHEPETKVTRRDVKKYLCLAYWQHDNRRMIGKVVKKLEIPWDDCYERSLYSIEARIVDVLDVKQHQKKSKKREYVVIIHSPYQVSAVYHLFDEEVYFKERRDGMGLGNSLSPTSRKSKTIPNIESFCRHIYGYRFFDVEVCEKTCSIFAGVSNAILEFCGRCLEHTNTYLLHEDWVGFKWKFSVEVTKKFVVAIFEQTNFRNAGLDRCVYIFRRNYDQFQEWTEDNSERKCQCGKGGKYGVLPEFRVCLETEDKELRMRNGGRVRVVKYWCGKGRFLLLTCRSLGGQRTSAIEQDFLIIDIENGVKMRLAQVPPRSISNVFVVKNPSLLELNDFAFQKNTNGIQFITLELEKKKIVEKGKKKKMRKKKKKKKKQQKGVVGNSEFVWSVLGRVFEVGFGEKKEEEGEEEEKEGPKSPKKIRECVVCQSRGKMMKCSRCKSAFYCSRKCQKVDWKRHRKECTFSRN